MALNHRDCDPTERRISLYRRFLRNVIASAWAGTG